MGDNKLNILLVEDETITATYFKKVLRKHRITHIQDGRQGYETYRANPQDFDIILMDNRLPGMKGIDSTTQIRMIDKIVPIIMVSVSCFDMEIAEAFDAGVSEYLSKPIRPSTLRDVIDNYAKQLLGE